MDSFRFRPQVDGLEDRVVPATPTELFNLAVQADADRTAVLSLLGDPNQPRSVYTLTRLSEDLAARTQRLGVASTAFVNAMTEVQAVVAANPAVLPAYVPVAAWVQTNAANATAGMIYGSVILQNVNLSLVAAGATVPAAGQLPAPPPPPAAPPPPSETGQTLSETIPSLDAPEWQNVEGSAGLRFWDTVVGTGDTVQATDTIQVNYVGWLTDGTVFDSSLERGEPLESPLSGLIQGWQKGIPGMKVGGTRRLDIPADLAYGAAGSGSSIPPNARLVFEFEMLDTTPASSSTSSTDSSSLSQEQIQDLLAQQSGS